MYQRPAPSLRAVTLPSGPPLVTIAIPTLIAGSMLGKCIGALESQAFREFEVVIINNGATAVDPMQYSASFPLRVIAPGTNVGFGAAVNLAIRASAARYVATLNDDTLPDPGWLQALVAAMERDPKVGMCASRIRSVAGDTLDSAGMLICLDGSSKQRGQGKPVQNFAISDETLFPSACAALYRRRMLDEIGVFDEDYFLYCEDTDLGLRGVWGGWKCQYVAEATICHHYSQTSGAVSPLKARYVERNRLWVAIKTFPASALPVLPFVALSRYFWQLNSVRNKQGAAGDFIQSGNSLWGAAAILIRAHWETLIRLPALLRKRAAVRRTRKATPSHVMSLMRRHAITPRELARL
jgi:GT2 family glycosyltransferase